MADSEAFFIGGPFDGQRTIIKVPLPAITVQVRHAPPRGRAPRAGRPEPAGRVDSFEYRREFIRGHKTMFPVYVPTDWTGDDMIQALMQGYTASGPMIAKAPRSL